MLKPHCSFEILRNKKLFHWIWKQVFPESLYGVLVLVSRKSIAALAGTLHLYCQAKCLRECHSSTAAAGDPSGEGRALDYTAEAKWDSVGGFSSFHPGTLNYKHLMAESHTCLRELNIFKRQGRHLNTLWNS